MPSKKSKVLLWSVTREEGPREAQRNALVLTLGAASDFTGLNACTALPKMRWCKPEFYNLGPVCKAVYSVQGFVCWSCCQIENLCKHPQRCWWPVCCEHAELSREGVRALSILWNFELLLARELFFLWYYNVKSSLWKEAINVVKLGKPHQLCLDYLWVYCNLPFLRLENILRQQFFISLKTMWNKEDISDKWKFCLRPV